MAIRNWLFLLIISTVFFSCSDDPQQDKSDGSINEPVDLTDHLKMDSNEVRMFTMPTPMQLPTTLSLLEAEYNPDLLLSTDQRVYSSNNQEHIYLGMSIVDLGYTTVYNDQQNSIAFAKNIQQMMENLHLTAYTNNKLIRQFERNKENQDSLYQIILGTFGEAHQYFVENEQEQAGLLILLGAYIEGAYLFTQSSVSGQYMEEIDQTLVQQKMFLDNFILLIGAYTDQKDMLELHTELQKLGTAFEGIEYKHVEGSNKAYEVKPIKPQVKENIKNIIFNIRKQLTN